MPTPTFTYPQKPQLGDKVAILSPSSGLPGLFPAVFEQGLQRLRDVFQLVPVEYPTTRKMNAPLEERARDVYAAFADAEIKAIIGSIGGDDQIKLLKYLDADVIKAHPRPFFGYSDNTNLHVLLSKFWTGKYAPTAIFCRRRPIAARFSTWRPRKNFLPPCMCIAC